MRLRSNLPSALFLSLAFACLTSLTGCGHAPVSEIPPRVTTGAIAGQVYGGQQPVGAATIQLYAAGTSTDGGVASPLFSATITTSDGTGMMNANASSYNSFNALPTGSFNFSGSDFTCASGGTLLYLVASGGNPGNSNGAVNPQLKLMSSIGTCTNLKTNVQSLAINEITTVAAVAGLAPYMTAYNAVGSTPAHASSLLAAFNVTNEYGNFQTGAAPGPALPAGSSADTPDVNALANSLATCVNSSGGVYNDNSPCGTLFLYSKPASAGAPADVVGALLDIRLNPTQNVAAIFILPKTGAVPFQPVNQNAPADWTLPITTTLTSAPTFSVGTGTYTSVQSVTMSDADPNAAIYYTTDGSTPGMFSALYSSPVMVGASETLNAIAIDGSARSAVTSAIYTLNLAAPTSVSLSAVTSSGSPTAITATSSANGSVVTFGTANGATGSFSPATCTITSGTCTVNYVPTGTLAVGTYSNGLTASFAASGGYAAASASSTLTIAPGYAYTVLTNFTNTSGSVPGGGPQYGNLIQANDGFFYGMTSAGGASNDGTVFKMNSTGAVTLLRAFTNAAGDGGYPTGGLVQGTDGSVYGMTYYGGSGSNGTFFKTTSAGGFTLLHSFNQFSGDAGGPEGDLVQGTDGNFYGTALGGSSSQGTAFKLSPSGTYTLLHTFAGGSSDGAMPNYGLVQGADGNFYGMTQSGGSGNNGSGFTYGTIFKMTPGGAVSLLHSFGNASNGANPYGGLIQGTDGSFYGMALYGGANFEGTVFKITAAGTLTLLHSFAGGINDGQQPYGNLVQGTDGNFYGLTYEGGASNRGTIFQITPGGTFTLIHSFAGGTADGSYPKGGLVQGTDGNFYGMTYLGGTSNVGVIFKVSVSPALAAPVVLTVPASATRASSFTLGYAVSNASSTNMAQCFATNSGGDTTGWVGVKTAATSKANATLTAPAAPGTYTYTLTCGGVESGFATLNVQ